MATPVSATSSNTPAPVQSKRSTPSPAARAKAELNALSYRLP
jgi:hypothetical protein